MEKIYLILKTLINLLIITMNGKNFLKKKKNNFFSKGFTSGCDLLKLLLLTYI